MPDERDRSQESVYLQKETVHITDDGKSLRAILDNCDNCGKPLTVDELAQVDQVLRPYHFDNLIVMECAACTVSRDCPDEEYFTDLQAVAEAYMDKHVGGDGLR